MLGVFLLGNFLLKLPVSLSMAAGAIAGALVGGEGIPLRHLFEGTFVYMDTVLIISMAMIFMTVIQKSGALEALNAVIVSRFHKVPAVMLILLMLIIMFPGMITGSSTAAVLSAGAIVAPILPQTGAILAVGAIMGMAAPPVNIPAMLIAGGVDMPYIGFEGPLAFMTFPCAIFTVLFVGLRYCRHLDYDKIKEGLNLEVGKQYGLKLYIPILVVIVLMVGSRALPNVFPSLGMPLIFFIGSVVGLFTGKKFNAIQAVSEAVETTVPVLGKLMGVGMFIQVMTLTGVRGYIVVSCFGFGLIVLYAAVCLVMPAFGAVSSYGAASVLGVPFLLALLEDCGYMSRAAVVLDPIFKKVGLSGKSVIPFVITTGCAVPGIMASRTIRNERERRATAMLAPFMPCGAKIPVIALFAGAFFDNAGWVSATMYLTGIVLIFFGALLVNKVAGYKNRKSFFIIELPEYKIPSLWGAFKAMCSRGWAYIMKAATIILLCNTAVQIMQTFDWSFGVAASADSSILASIAAPFAWLLVPIVGVVSWQLAAAAVTGFIAKESVVSTLQILLGTAAVSTLFTAKAALSFLVFTLLYTPCVAAIAAIRRETGSALRAALIALSQCCIAWLAAFAVYHLTLLL